MTVTSITIGLMLLALWLAIATSFRLRNWRATTLGMAGTVGILIAGLLPYPVGQVIQAGLWGMILLVLLTRSELVAVLAPAEYQFVERYFEILRGLARLGQRARQTDSAAYVVKFSNAIVALEPLDAPGDWAQLQADTVRELNRRLTRMRLLEMPTSEDERIAEDRWLAIENRFQGMLKTKANFWTGWPHPTRRSDT